MASFIAWLYFKLQSPHSLYKSKFQHFDIVIHITRSDVLGGAQKYILSILPYLQKSKKILIVTAPSVHSSDFSDHLNHLGVSIYASRFVRREINLISDFLLTLELFFLFCFTRCNCVWLHSSKAALLGRIACALSLKPSILTVHGWSFSSCKLHSASFRFFVLIEYLAQFLTRKYIIICRHDYHQALIRLHIPKHKLSFVYNSVPDTSGCISQHTKSLNILYLGRIDRQKNLQLLIRAFVKLIKTYPDAYLNIVGDGPLREECEHLAFSLLPSCRYKFYGFHSQVFSYYQQADIFVLPSNWEGFPLSSIEAMSHSLPLIVSDVGGAAETIIDGYNGFVLNDDNVNMLSYKLSLLCSSSSLRRRMGFHSREIYTQQFSFDLFVDKTLAILSRFG